MSASYNEIMETIKNNRMKKREGFTNKSPNNIAKKRSSQKEKIKSGSKDLVWATK